MLCAKTFQGQTYVGTTLGLFLLTKQDVVEEVFVNQSPVIKDKGPRKKKGLFSFLRKNTMEEPTEGQKSKNVKYALKLAGYVYKRVTGIDGKVMQLLEHNNQLLAAGIFGISTVQETKSTPITLTPVRSVCISKSVGEMLASTLDDEIKSFVPKEKGWQETNLLEAHT